MAFRVFRRFRDLLDVTFGTPSDGDIPVYDSGTGKMVMQAPAAAAGAAPDSADYLVGTANGTLSAEIVVGTSPGGELGGTWASPTVGATHSGSSHAAVQAAAEATAASALSTHSSDTTGVHGIADTSALETTAGAQAKVDAHVNDTTDAHDASAISIQDTANDFTATDVEGALAELQSDHETDAQNLADHIADATAAHAASAIAFTPDGSIAATTVQAAIVEVRDEAGGGGAPTDVDYLVGTASGGLSAEIVVGTSPGGELGGTWASPTVDATHSGSSHAAVQAAAEATAAAALSAHLSDVSDAHDASAVSVDSTTLVGTGTDVQAVLEELDNGIADHLADATAAHAATAISFSPAGTIAATTVQAAIEEVASEAGGGGGGSTDIAIDFTNPRSSSLGGNVGGNVIALTDIDLFVWEFLKDVEGKLYGTCRVPSNYVSGGSLRVAVMANATSGVTRMGVATKAVADGESMNPTLTDETAVDITVPGTAYLRKDQTYTLTETISAGDVLIVEVFHDGDHANDTLAVSTLLVGAWLEYTA